MHRLVPENDYKPFIAAFRVLNKFTFLIARFYYLKLEKEVNNIMDILWGCGVKFPT